MNGWSDEEMDREQEGHREKWTESKRDIERNGQRARGT